MRVKEVNSMKNKELIEIGEKQIKKTQMDLLHLLL